jgi:excisionase family DNA binding protein
MNVYTVAQAATELGVPVRTVLHRLKTGHMRGTQVDGRMWLIEAREVEAWRDRGHLRPGRRPPPPPSSPPSRGRNGRNPA